MFLKVFTISMHKIVPSDVAPKPVQASGLKYRQLVNDQHKDHIFKQGNYGSISYAFYTSNAIYVYIYSFKCVRNRTAGKRDMGMGMGMGSMCSRCSAKCRLLWFTKAICENLNLQRFSRPFANDVMSVLESYGLKVSEDERPYKPNELGDYFNHYSKVIALVKKGGAEQCIVLEGRDAMGDILIADPVTGLSYRQSANNLYYTWNWENLIVVKRCNTSMKCIE